MAAGSYEVSSTRFVHGSEKENSLYKNGSCRGYHLSKLSSSGDFNGHARGLFLDRDDEREHVDLLVEGKRSFGARWPRKDEEIAGFGDGTQMPPEKKRKYSPIVWDRYGEGVRISSKNRVVVTAHNTASKAPSDVSANQIRGLHIDLADSSLNDVFHGGSFDPLEDLSTLLPKDCQRNEEEADETDDHMNLRKISTSKWLNDFNCSDDEDISISDASIGFVSRRTRSDTDISSLDCSEGSRKRSSGSESDKSGQFKGLDCGDRYYENELEIDDNHDDDSFCIENIGGRKHRSVNMLQGCRSVFEYEKLNEINEGTYGVVFRGKDKATREVVALKKVKMGREEDDFPISSLREINILASLHHPSIVDVKEVVTDDRDGVFMVMEYMEHDLKGLMDVMKQPYSQSEVKCLMLQLLEGIKYLHDNWVIHRDLKTSNLLLNNMGELKICDFGMSRQYGSPLKPYTPLVVTLWYRAPELLLGAKKYSTAIDMWSVGCIMAELLSKEPLFKGEREIEQIRKIYETLGTPNESIWPGLSKLPGGKVTHVKQTYNTLRKKFPAATFIGSPVLTEMGFDLLNRLLTYNPEKRITAEDALNHGWFREVPLPKSKEFMPTFPPAQQRRSTSRKPKTRGW